MSDVIASYVQQIWKNADKNRRDLQIKWEDNRRYFLGNLFPDGEKPVGSPDETWKKNEGVGWRSKTFPNSTHSKVMSAVAVVLDTILTGGQIPFILKQSPWQERQFRSGVSSDKARVDAAIKDMEALIRQQFADSKAEREFIKNIISCALHGWTYAKMVVNEIKRSGWKAEDQDLSKFGISDMSRVGAQTVSWNKWSASFMAPHWKYIPLWDIFRDWETDDLNECSFIIHRQVVNGWWLRQKKGKPFFIDENIEKAINANKQGNDMSSPSVNNNEDSSNMSPSLRQHINYRTNGRQVLEYWGRIPREIVEEFEHNSGDRLDSTGLVGKEGSGDEVEVCASVVEGETTVRLARTTPDMRPFCQAKWEDNGDEFMPRGIADNCQDMHKVIKGTFNNSEDNAKLSGNVMIAVKDRFIKNMPQDGTLSPGQKFLLAEECDDARKAIQPIVIPDVSGSVVNLFQIAKQQFDEDSMVPQIAMGMVSEKGDRTAEEVAIRQASALKYTGLAIRNIDENLIEPMVMKFYDYNMNDPTVTTGNGNYLCQALGFSSFQRKTERIRNIMQLLQITMTNPKLEMETNVRYLLEEIVDSLDFDSDQALKSDDEKQQTMQMQQQNPMFQLNVEAQKAKIEKDKAAGVKSRADAAEKLARAHVNISAAEQYGVEKKTDDDASQIQTTPFPDNGLSSGAPVVPEMETA